VKQASRVTERPLPRHTGRTAPVANADRVIGG
jgi:hypothetical protein